MQMNFLAKNANAKLQKVCRLKQKRMGTRAVFVCVLCAKPRLQPNDEKKLRRKTISTQPNIVFNYLMRRL